MTPGSLVDSKIGNSGLALPKLSKAGGLRRATDLPPCTVGDSPSILYTRREDFGIQTDVLSTCSVIDDVAAWRPIQIGATTLYQPYSVMYEGGSTNEFLTKLSSRAPGVYILRLTSKQTATLSALTIYSKQDVQIVSDDSQTDVVFSGNLVMQQSTKLSFKGDLKSLTFTGYVQLATSATLTIAATVRGLSFANLYQSTLAKTSKIDFSGNITVDARILGFAAYTRKTNGGSGYVTHNAGQLTFGDNVSTVLVGGLLTSTEHKMNGALPGTVTVTRNTGGSTVVSRAEGQTKPQLSGGSLTWLQGWSSVRVWSSTSLSSYSKNRNGKTFDLFLMNAETGFSHNSASATKYKQVCTAAGLKTVGTGYSSYYSRCSSYGCMPLPASGWGSTTDVDNQIISYTKWASTTLLLHSYNYGYPMVYNSNNNVYSQYYYHPVCAREH